MGVFTCQQRPAPQRPEQGTAKQNSLETPGPLCICTTFRHAVKSRVNNISMKETCRFLDWPGQLTVKRHDGMVKDRAARREDSF